MHVSTQGVRNNAYLLVSTETHIEARGVLYILVLFFTCVHLYLSGMQDVRVLYDNDDAYGEHSPSNAVPRYTVRTSYTATPTGHSHHVLHCTCTVILVSNRSVHVYIVPRETYRARTVKARASD
jgi:hypothetical protein